ncbi:MAG: hypothetical protein ACK5L8_12610 [Marinicella pacifica]
MTSKVRIKAGNVEVEFEGSEDYMKDELPLLVELLYSLSPNGSASEEDNESESVEAPTDESKQKIQMTTNTIASKLSVKSGNDLVIAACAHLTFVKGADTFSRGNILAEMKLASNYYKANMSKNLSSSLKALVNQNKILETAKDTYALEATTKDQIGKQLNVT